MHAVRDGFEKQDIKCVGVWVWVWVWVCTNAYINLYRHTTHTCVHMILSLTHTEYAHTCTCTHKYG